MKLKLILVFTLFVSLFTDASVNADKYAKQEGEVFKLETLIPNNIVQIYNILINKDMCNLDNTVRNIIPEKGVLIPQFATRNQNKQSITFRLSPESSDSPIESIVGVYFPNVDDDQRYAVFTFFIPENKFIVKMKNVQSQGVHYSEVEPLIIKQIGSCLGL